MTRTSRLIRSLLYVLATLIALVIIAYIVWRVNLARDVNAKLAAIRAAGLPTSGAELNAYYSAVPDNENAALVMTQAFAFMQNYPDSRSNKVANFKIPPRGQSLTAQQKQLLSDYVEMNSDAFVKAEEAVKLPKSRYPIDFTPNFDALLPHLPNLRTISKLASFETLIALQAQNSREVASLISFQIALCHTLDAEPLPISQLIRGDIISSTSQLLECSLNQITFDETNLFKLQRDFVQVDESGFSSIQFIGERATTLAYFQNWPAMYSAIHFSAGDLPLFEIVRGRFGWFTGLFDREEIFYLNAMQNAIDDTHQSFPQCLSQYSTMYETALNGQRRGYIFVPGILNGQRNVLPKEVETISRVRIAVSALAVEHFRLAQGRLPENLNELVPQFFSEVPIDPFDGQPLRYHRLDKGYVIYSIGSDGEDNGGRERPASVKSTDKTHYDITFIVER